MNNAEDVSREELSQEESSHFTTASPRNLWGLCSCTGRLGATPIHPKPWSGLLQFSSKSH
jgi:hypothetical protein